MHDARTPATIRYRHEHWQGSLLSTSTPSSTHYTWASCLRHVEYNTGRVEAFSDSIDRYLRLLQTHCSALNDQQIAIW